MTERRTTDKVLLDRFDQLEHHIREHMDGEETRMQNIERKIEQYFGELEAHIHRDHHIYVAGCIDDVNSSKKMWTDVRKNIITQGLIWFIAIVGSLSAAGIYYKVSENSALLLQKARAEQNEKVH